MCPIKNLQKIGGNSLVDRSVNAVLQSKNVNRVDVSSHDQLIRNEARAHGASTVQRPLELSGESASSGSALLHALNQLGFTSVLEKNIIFVLCTSPFTTGLHIDAALQALENGNCNSAFSVVPWHGFLWTYDGPSLNHEPGLPRLRRQEVTT